MLCTCQIIKFRNARRIKLFTYMKTSMLIGPWDYQWLFYDCSYCTSWIPNTEGKSDSLYYIYDFLASSHTIMLFSCKDYISLYEVERWLQMDSSWESGRRKSLASWIYSSRICLDITMKTTSTPAKIWKVRYLTAIQMHYYRNQSALQDAGQSKEIINIQL